MKDRKRKESEVESDAFFEVDESVWEDDGGIRKKRDSGKRRHQNKPNGREGCEGEGRNRWD